ncbi:hypothetical protein FRC03_006292 [Tulasnella sp. 419]|nr:hypothetical protein FRC03_006292 [Tulasnella sp. 419]
MHEDAEAPEGSKDAGTSLFEETKKGSKRYKAKASVQDIEKLEIERQNFVDSTFAKLRELVDITGHDREEWLRNATLLTDHFRETRELFLGNRVSDRRWTLKVILTLSSSFLSIVAL